MHVKRKNWAFYGVKLNQNVIFCVPIFFQNRAFQKFIFLQNRAFRKFVFLQNGAF